MNRIRRITIECDLLRKMGRAPGDGVPMGALISWVQALKAQIPDSEEPSCMVYGTERLRAEYDHALSNEEALIEERDALLALAREFRSLVDSRTGALVPDAAERFVNLVKRVP